MNKQKDINWISVITAAFIPAIIQLLWLGYNSYVPLWLQAGNPSFHIPEGMALRGFGFGAFVTGIILTADNIASLFISPVIGMISDGTHSRFGRRKPWILFATPIAVISFILIPILALRIPADLSGQTEALRPYFIPFFLSLVFMLLPLAIIEVPSIAIIFDISPSRHRTTVNAIAAAVGGVTNVIGAIMIGILFDVSPLIPFLVGGILTAVIIVLAAIFIKEPPNPYEPADAVSTEISVLNLRKVFQTIADLPKENTKSLILLLVSILFSYSAFGQLQSFLSSYSVSFLGMSPSTASMVFAAAGGAYILGTIPGGMLPKYIKRKGTYLTGLSFFALVCVLIFIYSSQTLIWVYVGLGGFVWALCNVNQDVMVFDSATTDKLLDTYGGLLIFAKTLGFIIGPAVGGFVVQTFGNSYNNIWISMLIFIIVSIAVLLPVTSGEVRPEVTPA